MVPVERLPFEQQCHHHREDDERDDLLRDFQLNQRERSAVVNDADAVRRHLTDIFKQRDAPREENHGDERPRRTDFFLLKFEVPIPGKSHEDVGADEQKNGVESLHVFFDGSVCHNKHGDRRMVVRQSPHVLK